MVPQAAATSSTATVSPHSSTLSPTRASRPVRSTVIMSMETRPTSRVRRPFTATGVPLGAWRG